MTGGRTRLQASGGNWFAKKFLDAGVMLRGVKAMRRRSPEVLEDAENERLVDDGRRYTASARNQETPKVGSHSRNEQFAGVRRWMPASKRAIKGSGDRGADCSGRYVERSENWSSHSLREMLASPTSLSFPTAQNGSPMLS